MHSGLMLAWCGVQAVPLPEVGGVPEDPGQLPQPDKLTKAYFEVCSHLLLFTSHAACGGRAPLWEVGGTRGGGRGGWRYRGICDLNVQSVDGGGTVRLLTSLMGWSGCILILHRQQPCLLGFKSQTIACMC